jgi:uncharacterized membrane protein
VAPLFVLVGAALMLRAVGFLGVRPLGTWRDAARGALAIMLVFTASAHFTAMKHDLVAMIPPPFTGNLAIITVTGVLEIAGAVGILIPRTRRVAGICLVLLFVALLPANVSAALRGVTLRGESVTPLWLRVPLQILFITVTWWTAIAHPATVVGEGTEPGG